MSNVKRWAALLLAVLLTMTVVACGGSDSSSTISVPDPSVPQASSVPEPEPEPEPEPLNQAYLTGLAKDVNYPEGKRITAVMLNNAADSRPQNGIGEADILVEIRVEGGITRFMALYDDYEAIPKTGGLRSARDQFFQLLIPTRGFYVHEGPSDYNHPVNILMRNYEYEEFDVSRAYGDKLLTVDASRSTNIYSWYDVSGELITEAIQRRGLDDYRTYNSSFFNFVPYTEDPYVPADGQVTNVEVIHTAPAVASYFDYNAATGRYGMSMNNRGKVPTVDNNTGEQVMFDNVIVLYAPMTLYAASPLVKVNYDNGGVGYYFSQGGWELIRWEKGPPDQPLQLYKGDGSGVLAEINPGTTYLAVVDDALLESTHNALMGGTMGGSAGAEDPTLGDAED